MSDTIIAAIIGAIATVLSVWLSHTLSGRKQKDFQDNQSVHRTLGTYSESANQSRTFQERDPSLVPASQLSSTFSYSSQSKQSCLQETRKFVILNLIGWIGCIGGVYLILAKENLWGFAAWIIGGYCAFSQIESGPFDGVGWLLNVSIFIFWGTCFLMIVSSL